MEFHHWFHQVQIDEASQKYMTINTHIGMITYKRLPFRVFYAPAIFQRSMDGVLQAIAKVAVYLNYILVTGVTKEEHLRNLGEVLRRMEEAGLRPKRCKCTLLADEVQYLGHKVDGVTRCQS